MTLANESEEALDDASAPFKEETNKHYDLVEAYSNRLDAYMSEMKCAHDVVTDSVIVDEYKELYRNFTTDVLHQIEVTWKRCDSYNVAHILQ